MSTYVLSDIHGLKDRYDRMLETISFSDEDVLYCLGDVVDRGPEGVEILLDMMGRKNVTLLMGNHEYMMLSYLHELRKDTHEESNRWRHLSAMYELWSMNGGGTTLLGYEKLSRFSQDAVVEYVESLPLVIPDLRIGGKRYYLVHGAPVLPHVSDDIIYFKDLHPFDVVEDDDLVKSYLWDRVNPNVGYFDNRTVIFGHTMTYQYQNDRPYQIWFDQSHHNSLRHLFESKTENLIGIDCGCAANNKWSQLGCLRLDDLQEFYA